MHYANGKLAQVGDQVVGKDVSGNAVAGYVVKVYPEASTCNLEIMLCGAPKHTATADSCLLMSDMLSGRTDMQPKAE